MGVSLGVGIGIGLGVGLGLTTALAAFFASGVVQFTVTNAEAGGVGRVPVVPHQALAVFFPR